MALLIYFPTTTSSNDSVPSVLQTIKYDKILEINISVDITVSLSGATVKINVNSIDTSNLDLLYSIDNISYFASSIFTGQAEGNYTAYVKDKFGCVKTKEFTIDEVGSRDSYLYISEANSIDFVKIQEIDDEEVFGNDENLFECEDRVNHPYSNLTLFNKSDKPCLQIKSNFKNLKAYLRKEDETQDELLLSKMSDNLGRYEKLDCIIYSHPTGKLAIYFDTGNIYDEIDQITGQYELNGNLPLFGRIGNIVEVVGVGTLPIVNILFDSNINKKVLLFDLDYVSPLDIGLAACIYDLINYNIYEYKFDLSGLESGLYDVHVKGETNDGYIEQYLSENIDIQDKHDRTLSIVYYNENNRDVFYKYGIEHFMRIKYSDITRFNKDENEININDESSQLIKSFLNFGNKFLFEDLTKKQSDTLSIALSCENVFINGIGYLKESEPVIEKQENTNVYKLEINMIKSGIKYSTRNNVDSGTDDLTETLYVPTIVTSGINFIKG